MMPKALIVEDEAYMGELLAEIVRQRGFEPTVINQGYGVTEWVRQHRPQLVLLDLMLPGRSGYTICQEIKLQRETNLTPVVIVSARDQHRDMVKGFKVGANFYLTKPFSIDQLYAAIDHAMRWREQVEDSGAQGEIRFELQSDTRYLDELNQLLSGLFLFSGLSEDKARQLTMAVRELGANAIEWGHQKQIERVVTVTYRIDNDKIVITIHDTGPGFDPNNIPHAAHGEDPVAHMEFREKSGLREGGFGILLARGLVDEMKYNEEGNEVTLVKYFAGKSECELTGV
ncbi:MAG: ATP-binding protein [Tepidisphaeraceae bacterium]